MSISGLMRTSASGMEAQSNRLSTVADNIANVATVGYKRASTEFSSFIPTQATTQYTPGSVVTHVRHAVSQQGTFAQTNSPTDLAVNGEGFFIVSDENGQPFLTRAGSFVPNGSGELINAAGFKLMGYSLANGQPPIVANGTAGLQLINIKNLALQAVPSTAGTFSTNLPVDAPIVAATDLPSTNSPTATFTDKTSLVAFDDLGRQVTLDVYTSKTAAETWEITAYNQADAAAGGGFPYATGPLATDTLTFDPTTGALASGSPTSLTVPVPNGSNLVIDLSQTSQLAAPYTVISAQVNGNAPSAVDRVEIDNKGVLNAIFQNGTRLASYQIPLATVPSPDNMTPLPGDVYQPSSDSGDLLIGFAGSGSFGLMENSSLEQSTVDLANELTLMIESEKNFQVNAKVFQTGEDLLDVVVNLKR